MLIDPKDRTEGAGISSGRSRFDETIDANADPSADDVAPLDYSTFLAPALEPDELGRLAHYRVVKLLGRGGMGAVFQAEDLQLQRTVALKVILPESAASPAARERFLREARACAALKNDHVVTIYQVGQDQDVPFLAMEFLQGKPLDESLNEGQPLPIADVLRIGLQAADGLAAAHKNGVIHRDIKPGNIWIEEPSGRVKLLDFGLARTAGTRSDLTQTGRVVGTPEFMSPEQARGEELDGRSDLFSLGTVLYAICTGHKPFQGTSVMAVLTALAVDTPAPLRQRNANVPPELATLIDQLMQKDRRNRPASAEEVRDALAAIEEGRPVPAGLARRSAPKPALKRWLGTMAIGLGAGLAVALALGLWLHFRQGDSGDSGIAAGPSGPPIRIGILHSRTGTMAISERPVIDAVLLAVEQINEQGGLLGRPVEAVLADGQSDETVFAREAERLIQEEKVCTVFGCWTSASRKAVAPVFQRHDHLLLYPVQYEGVEQSPNIVYLGLVPNQQIVPALRWLVGFENKRRWFLVGSDYVFPATANAVIRDEAKARGCEIVGEEYLLLGSTDVSSVVKRIVETKPDLIVNTINGDTNVAFFRELRRAGISAKNTPTLSFSISEQELQAIGPRDSSGNYVAANYFQSLDLPANQELLRSFGQRFGAERALSSPMATTYAGVGLWARAVRAANSDSVAAIRHAIRGQLCDSPYGPIHIDPATQHVVQIARVGRIDDAGKLTEVYRSPQAIVPEPFPSSRSRPEWESFVESLRKRWGGRWSNPGS